MEHRRKHFLINKPLQLRYMAYVTITLIAISVVCLASLYIGIWGGILNSFSDDRIRNELLIASRLTQYDEARAPQQNEAFSPLSLFKQTEKMTQRQREIFKEILDKTNKDLFLKLMLLLAMIAWGSIYISHKVAGPLYRFQMTLREMAGGNMATRVRLRKNDEAQFLADEFNNTLGFLDKTFSELKTLVREKEKASGPLAADLKKELVKIKTSADPSSD